MQPGYHFGETVYVKEAWCPDNTFKGGSIPRLGISFGEAVEWKLGNPNQGGKWRSPLFMPAWAGRTFLLILSAHPERLHEITDKDAIAEGVTVIGRPELNELSHGKFIHAYATLWDSINPKHPWASNPFVWVIRFRLDRREHDQGIQSVRA